MSLPKPKTAHERKVALCYIRQSQTRDEDDLNSPDRQRDNILRICDQNGWTPELFEDVGGHRSGTSETHRPEWKALKQRIGDPDVVAVVANDLSRLHRNLAGTSQLLELLEKHGVSLVLAASNNDIDVTTLTGQMFAQVRALMDAFYAKDVSAKAKDSVAYRKRRGITIGMPPFGTERNKEGHLIPSQQGAWLLPTGDFQAGEASDSPPEGAVWRGYHACAELILRKYVEKGLGMHRIAYEMKAEGWAFRDRKGVPRAIHEDDIRRVLSNWAEYGGLVFDQKAKDRPAYEAMFDIDELPFIPERAVFPLDLIKAVARLRQERSVRPINQGVNRETYPYPLAGLVFCAHCEALAQQKNDPRLRTRLGGAENGGKRRYRHKNGILCGIHNRSVWITELEADFGRLVKLLSLRPEYLNLITELAIQSEKGFRNDIADWEGEKQAAIALCRRRIDAAINLYRDGVITREEYMADVERNQRDIAHWEARTHDTQQMALELAMCMNAVSQLAELWEQSDPEERQALARSLFTELVYDLDKRQIVDFKLKPWADRFLILRAKLYATEESNEDEGNGTETTSLEGHNSENQANNEADFETMYTDMGSTPVWGKGYIELEASDSWLAVSGSTPSSTSYKAVRTIKKRSAQGLSVKSTIRP